MYSVTKAQCGACLSKQAPMNRQTLGWRKRASMAASARNCFSSCSDVRGTNLTATSVAESAPMHLPKGAAADALQYFDFTHGDLRVVPVSAGA